MAGIKEPVLFVGGGKDSISPPQDLQLLAMLAAPGSKTIEIPEANHFVIGYWFQGLGQDMVPAASAACGTVN